MKEYTKPDIVFESFSLSTSIANCAVKIKTWADGDCGFRYGRFVIFLDGIDGCAVKTHDGNEIYDGLCYQVPTEATSLFNS